MMFPLIGYLRRIADQTWLELEQHNNTLDASTLSERAKQDAGQLLLEAAWADHDSDSQSAAVARAWATLQRMTGLT